MSETLYTRIVKNDETYTLLREEFEFRVVSKSRFELNGSKHNITALESKLSPFITDVIAYLGLLKDFKNLSDRDSSRIIKAVADRVLANGRTEADRARAQQEVRVNGVNYSGLGIAHDIHGEDQVVYDRKTMQALEWEGRAFLKTVPTYMRKDFEEAIPCKLLFDPMNLEQHWIEDWKLGSQQTKLNYFNTHRPPAFRFLERDADLHPLLERYLHALAGEEEVNLHVCLSWGKTALTGRCKTILVLVGIPESGKSFFGQLLGALAGHEYYIKAQNEFFSTRFNSILGDKRIILVDEGAVKSQSEMNNAKKYVENYFNPEKKGIDANKLKKIQASIIVTSNNYSDFAFTPEERKFTVPEVGKRKMREFFSKDEWDELEALLEDDEFLIETYNYFMEYPTLWTPTTDYQNETFWRCVVEGGLNDRDKAIYLQLTEMNDEPIGLREFLRLVSRTKSGERRSFRVGYRDIERMLMKFAGAGYPIAELVGRDNKIRSLIGKKEEIEEEVLLDL